MSSEERVNKFADDQQKLLVPGEAEKSSGKIVAEVKRLRTWLQKHQDERLPDAAKGKLLSTIQSYFKAGVSNDQLRDDTQSLVEDLLKLPEGKLVSAKAKKAALKWLSGGGDAGDGNQTSGGESTSANEREMLVVDLEEGYMSLMSEKSGDVVDGVVCEGDWGKEVEKLFQAGEEVHVLMSEGVVLGIVRR